MTKGKRIVSFILSAIMVLSSTVTGYAEGQERIGGTEDTAYVEGMSGMDEIQASGSGEKAEGDNQALSVSILEGKGKILIKGDTGFEEVMDESGLFPMQLNISEEEVLHIEVIPEKSYQVSTYRTLMDSGTVEEIVDEEILNKEESFKKDLSLKETESLEVSFKEEAEEQTEAPAESEEEPEETDPQESGEEVTGSPYDMQEVKDILNSTELDLTVTPPTEEENAECDAVFGDGISFFSAQEYEGVGAIGSIKEAGSLSTDYGWEHADINIFDYWDGYPEGWKEIAKWQRGVIGVRGGTNGIPAYCVEPGVHYERQDREIHNALEFYSQDIVTELALACQYVENISDEDFMSYANDNGMKEISQVYAGKYYVKQIIVWNVMEQYYPKYTGYHDISFSLSNAYISHGFLGWVVPEALNYAKENLRNYRGYGKILHNTGSSDQKVGVFQAVPVAGSIEIQKSSADPALTNGNSCYSLQGAVYGIYERGTDNQVASITTDANGYGRADDLPVGDYDIRELTAPSGFALDTSVGHVTVTANQMVTYSCTDRPQNDPVRILLGKVDAETNQNRPQGSGSLENAEFTVKYYQGQYDTDPVLQGINAERTWIVKTNGNGFCMLLDNYKVSGDDFYKIGGIPTLPLGTITIQETKPPVGYLINEEVFVRQITSEGYAESVTTYNQPTVPETAQKGVIRLQKVDAETNGQPSTTGTLEGAVYEVFDSAGARVDTLTTDAQGKAESRKLPMGTYSIKEKTPSNGYILDTRIYTITFEGDTSSTPVFYKDVTSRETPQMGVIRLQKQDRETNGQPSGDGTLKGAEYDVLDASNKKVDTMVTDEEGKAESKKLPLGTYLVKESKSSVGYIKDTKGYRVTLTPDQSNASVVYGDVTSKEMPQKGIIKIAKKDSETDENVPQGAASLKGAVYEIRNSTDTVVDTLTTDKDGRAESRELPLGTYTVKETKNPEGYNLDENIYTVKLTSENREERVFYKTQKSPEDVIRGDVQIVKFGSDQEAHKNDIKKPLKDIQFIFTSKTTGKKYTITTDENGYANTQQLGNKRGGLIYDTYTVTEKSPYPDYAEIQPFEVTIKEEAQTFYYIIENDVIEAPVSVVKKDTTTGRVIPVKGTRFQILDSDKNVIEMTVTHYPEFVVQDTWETDATGSFMLPEKLKAGTYYLQEVEAPKGYLRGEPLEFSVDSDHDWDSPIVVEYADTPVMGNIVIHKTDEETEERLKGAVFAIFAAEDIQTADGTIRAQKDQVVDTITTDENGQAVSKDLYLGKYTVKEIKPAPGYVLSDHSYEAELKYKDQTTAVVTEPLEIENQPTTIKVDKKVTGSEQRLAGVKFAIWNKAMMDDVDPGIARKEILTTDENGQIRVERLLPGTYCIQEVEGVPGYAMDAAIYEVTIDENGRMDGKGETTVTVENPKTEIVGTTAVSLDTDSQLAITKKETKIADKVRFKNLQVGSEVLVQGILIDKETQEPLLIDGQQVTAEMKFTAESADQEVENLFQFDASALAGKQVVVFEKAFIGDVQIAAHEDINDKDQAVSFPEHEVKTTAKNEDTGDQEAAANKEVTIMDKVQFKGLIVGQEYTVKGLLMDKTSGKELLVDGKPVTAEKKFTAEKAEGSIELAFTFDARALTGKTVVVFERLYVQDVEVAVHADIEDKDQTIEFPEPEIGTTAKDKDTNTHQGVTKEKTTIVDTVHCTGLITGQEYTLKGVVMSKTSGQELLIDGKPVTAEKSFVAEKKNQDVELEFTFNSSALKGQEIVVFERLYIQDTEIAVHTDINDKDQTVEFPEHKIKTQAKDKETGSQEIKAQKNVTIVDTVTYEGLIPGKEYILKGILMDKETGKPLLVQNKEVTAETVFVTEKADGTAEVEFTFDAQSAAGKELVVFEYLYTDSLKVASHADIQDEGQTVKVKEIETRIPPSSGKPVKEVVKTGDPNVPAAYAAAGILALCTAVWMLKRRSRRK